MSDEPTIGHNSVTASQLNSFIERIERLNADKQNIAEDQKEVYAEAKAVGYDNKAIRKIVAMRKQDAGKLAEEQAIVQLYIDALGLDFLAI